MSGIPSVKSVRKTAVQSHVTNAALSADIQALVLSADTNLVRKEKRLKELLEVISELGDLTLEKQLTPVFAELHEQSLELKAQHKWLELGLDDRVLSTHADCVLFCVRSGLAASIAMFCDATTHGRDLHAVRYSGEELLLLIQGEYRPWSYIKTLVVLDRLSGNIVSKTAPDDIYTYISPDGLVKMSRTSYPIMPIEQLQHDDLLALQRFAQTSTEKPCVLQVVTTNDHLLRPSWLTSGINSLQAMHTAIRLVDTQGKVWSFGVELTREFEEYVKEHPCSFLSTGLAKIGSPDYRDTRSFDEKLVTHLPIAKQTLDAILNAANNINASVGMDFALTTNNCNTFGIKALEHAGIHLNTQASIAQLISKAVPKIVAQPFEWLVGKIQSVVAPIFSIPYVSDALFFIPRKMTTFATNSMFMLLGLSPWKLFDDESSFIHHPYKLVEWQRLQKTTICYPASSSPKMHLLPKYP